MWWLKALCNDHLLELHCNFCGALTAILGGEMVAFQDPVLRLALHVGQRIQGRGELPRSDLEAHPSCRPANSGEGADFQRSDLEANPSCQPANSGRGWISKILRFDPHSGT